MPHTLDSRARIALAAAALAACLALTADRADAAVTPTIENRTLLVTGDATSEKLALRVPVSAPTTVEVDLGDNGSADFRFRRADFDLARVRAGDGADRVRVEDPPIRGAATLPTILDGQGGNDTLLGGRGADTIIGGDGVDLVDGNGAADSVSLGAGNDQFAWESGDGSDSVEGGDGFDALAATATPGADQLRLVADGASARIEVGAAALDASDVERADATPLGGDDAVAVGDLTGTKLQELRLDLADADTTDRLVVEGTPKADFASLLGSSPDEAFLLGMSVFVSVKHADLARDELTINGREGNDRIEAGSANTAKLALDGGPGDDTLTGSNAADLLIGGDGRDFVDSRRGDDTVQLGAGDDTATSDTSDGRDTLEGGAGSDSFRFSGSSANERFAFTALGTRVRLTRADALAVDAGGFELASLLSFGGADTVTVGSLSGTPVHTVDLSLFDFAVPGGNTDAVIVDGTAGADQVAAASDAGVVNVTGLAARSGSRARTRPATGSRSTAWPATTRSTARRWPRRRCGSSPTGAPATTCCWVAPATTSFPAATAPTSCSRAAATTSRSVAPATTSCAARRATTCSTAAPTTTS